jgi:hypothetical protein
MAVHSEEARKPQTDVRYLNGKLSLNHAAHQLKEGIQQSEVLRTDTAFQKACLQRWVAVGPPRGVECRMQAGYRTQRCSR